VNLNEWLVSSGWALAYREYSRAYVGAEAEAKGGGRGMWAGDFVPPWDWRRGSRG
jgi:endonuclease YncB( thermonuclease family)